MVAATFHMDPAQVMTGTDWDLAYRLAALNRYEAMRAAAEVTGGG